MYLLKSCEYYKVNGEFFIQTVQKKENRTVDLYIIKTTKHPQSTLKEIYQSFTIFINKFPDWSSLLRHRLFSKITHLSFSKWSKTNSVGHLIVDKTNHQFLFGVEAVLVCGFNIRFRAFRHHVDFILVHSASLKELCTIKSGELLSQEASSTSLTALLPHFFTDTQLRRENFWLS